MTLRVLSPGLSTTIQDLGRPGRQAAGIPLGGAMDRFALAAANLLVGNAEGAGALECPVEAPALKAEIACVVAITGADFQPLLNGISIPQWSSLLLAEGDVLSFKGRASGARCYVAVAGGLEGERWLGSVGTHLLAGRGGLGRSLRTGDELRVKSPPGRAVVVERELPARLRPVYGRGRLAVIPGPHHGLLAPAGRLALTGAIFRVSREADRMGYRLEGPSLELRPVELLSFGVTAGCLQVPPSGHPILLMADHQTAGGYPVVATVSSADLPLAAQLLPGDEIGLTEVTLAEALVAGRCGRAALDTLRT